MSADLVRYDAACRAVAEAKAVDELIEIRDQTAAMQAAARVAKNRQLEADAAEIRERAERRIGEMMAVQRETVGLATGTAGQGRPKIGGLSNNPPKKDPTLAEAGIDKNLAHRARSLAAQSPQEFEAGVTEKRQAIIAKGSKPAGGSPKRPSARPNGRARKRTAASATAGGAKSKKRSPRSRPPATPTSKNRSSC